jgi:hypothetical protein
MGAHSRPQDDRFLRNRLHKEQADCSVHGTKNEVPIDRVILDPQILDPQILDPQILDRRILDP